MNRTHLLETIWDSYKPTKFGCSQHQVHAVNNALTWSCIDTYADMTLTLLYAAINSSNTRASQQKLFLQAISNTLFIRQH